MELLHQLLRPFRLTGLLNVEQGESQSFKQRFTAFITSIKSIGITADLDEYESRKQRIFNLLNFFQIITGMLFPIVGLLFIGKMPYQAWVICAMPSLISLVTLWLNSRNQHQIALLFYFFAYPVFTAIVYINGINLGVELSFVLYGILSVFFLQDIGYMLFSVALSMVSYFVLSVLLQEYHYQLKTINIAAYLFNQALAIAYIFYGLYLIKKENTGYQSSIVEQKSVLGEQAVLLKKQADDLEEMNSLNNKLFSIISHDLKAPMYALRNLFRTAKEMNMPAKEIRGMLPDVINDLNYTTGLMENLLHWAKSQLQAEAIRPRELSMNEMIDETINLLKIQADAKKISIHRKTDLQVNAFADHDMTSLVLRNLLSNAIKYTPVGGTITLGTLQHGEFTEVFVQDSGMGISREAMEKINESNFYTTRGTASESGTGLGLMLCREFLSRNGGHLMIESEPGSGSTFSFALPAQL